MRQVKITNGILTEIICPKSFAQVVIENRVESRFWNCSDNCAWFRIKKRCRCCYEYVENTHEHQRRNYAFCGNKRLIGEIIE